MAEPEGSANERRGAVFRGTEPVDYSRPFQCSEPLAKDVVNQILVDGGYLLWEHYLFQKAFGFARESAVESVVAGCAMCFVPCEPAEDDIEEWVIEEEPRPQKQDNWSRMCLVKRDELRMRDTFASTKDSTGFPIKKKRKPTQTLETVAEDKKPRKKPVDAPRAWSIEEKPRLDPEEERYRTDLFNDRKKKAEKDKRMKLEKIEAEETRIRVEALHEEMEKRPHSFDLEGNVLWIEPPNVAKLPKFQDLCNYHLKLDKATLLQQQQDAAAALNSSKTTPRGPATNRKKKTRQRKKREPQEVFSDGYTAFNHAQPPILESMNLKPGVILEHKGKAKKAPDREAIEGQMTREEYLQSSRREISGDTQLQFTMSGGVHAVGGNSGKAPIETPSPKAQRKESEMSLPALDKGRPPPLEGGSDGSPGKDGSPLLGGSGMGVSPGDARSVPSDMVLSPTAPPHYTRARKFDSIGHIQGRPPRSHPPSLGKLDIFSSDPKTTQPPIGATMGHGLMKHKDSLEEYFFPPIVASPSSAVSPSRADLGPRSISEAVLPKDRNPALELPYAAGRSPKHGNIVPEVSSTAYRNARKQLFEPAARAGLSIPVEKRS